ncbi:hypothetical protein LWI29_008963 [Acer saccharum]|uniref:Uncharacterized protein n=1 Tax=Acer saccharum TaxID=4024 RepID=A0AA39TD03_ACESA|nr:hypothetical protein LWI29_008963 [Acer saccharum]
MSISQNQVFVPQSKMSVSSTKPAMVSSSIANPAVVPSNIVIDLRPAPPMPPTVPSTHGMVTRSQTGALKPRAFSALCQSPCSSSPVPEPTNVKAALTDPRSM